MGHVSGFNLLRLLRGATGDRLIDANFENGPAGIAAALLVGRSYGVPDTLVVQAYLQDMVERAGLSLHVDVYEMVEDL